VSSRYFLLRYLLVIFALLLFMVTPMYRLTKGQIAFSLTFDRRRVDGIL